ncbi:MAG: DALR domain-containing protein [Solirubrobacteraceae bacterium]
MREIRLYDSLSGQLVPVSAGDAIRVEVRTSPSGSEGAVDVESTRPLVLFSFLERFLQREGFGTKFLFDSPSDEDTMYELSEELEQVPEPDATAEPPDTEMSLHEVPRTDVERWVNVCFGGGRDGEEWQHVPRGKRITLTDALKEFGHPAVAMYLLGTHYSLPLGDACTGLQTGSKNVQRLRDVMQTLAPDEPSPPDMRHHVEAFRDALADDLNTPLAFVVLFEWVLEAERRGGGVGDGDLRIMLDALELDGLATPVGAP